MGKAGKIYILRNSAIENTIIKIGRTGRSSEQRAKEISNATGVPLDFEVLYEEDVFDCVLAEKLIHKLLYKNRVNPNREFFRLPLKEAVRIVFKICLKVNNSIKKKSFGKVAIFIDVSRLSQLKLHRLKMILQNFKGKTPVFLTLATKNFKQIVIKVGKNLFVRFTPALINELRNIRGINNISWHSQKIDKIGKLLEENLNIGWDDPD